MKIVILDGYCENPGDLSWDPIKEFGELIVYDRTKIDDQEIINRIEDASIVITNKTPINRNIIDHCPSIKFICEIATGFNNIDIEYAKEKGIKVANVPTYGTRSVSQYTIALLLELCHHIGHHSDTVFSGKWQNCEDFCYWDYPLIELFGKTMGIIGCGNIGVHTAIIANALGMKILAYDNNIRDEVKDFVSYVELDELYQKADVIVLHIPLFKQFEKMINSDSISKMKDGVLLINSSRGGLINEDDVAKALNNGKIAGFAADVVSSEPIKADNPLLQAKNCIITPHIAWAAKESRQRIMDTTIDNIKAFIDGNPINIVNK